MREGKRLGGGKEKGKIKKMNKQENLHFTKTDQWLQLSSTNTIYKITQHISAIQSSRINYLTN